MSLLLHRTCTILLVGVVAGAAHSYVRSAGGRPIKLTPDAPTPLNLPPRGGATAPVTTPPVEPATTPTPTTGTTPTVPPPQPEPPATHDSLDLTLDQAKALFDQQVAFIDARHLPEYEAGHVQNAFLLGTEGFATSDVLNYLDRSQPMVVYCSGGACDASKNLVILLQQAGFGGARIMEDGYPAWEKAGYPTAKGKPAIGGAP